MNELFSRHPERVSTPVTDQARVMKAAATPKESFVFYRHMERDDDYWNRVDRCIDEIKLREFEKEEGI